MLTQRFLNNRFSADGVVAKDHAITPDIEGQILAALGKKYRWLVERVSVSDFVIDILVRRGNLGDQHFRVFDLPLNILKDDARAINLVDSDYLAAKLKLAHIYMG